MIFYYLFVIQFPYALVKEGRLPFKFKDLNSYISDPNHLFYFFLFILIVSLGQVLIDSIKWLYFNRESYLIVISNSVTFTFFLLFGYILFILSAHQLLKGIDVKHETVPYYPHALSDKLN